MMDYLRSFLVRSPKSIFDLEGIARALITDLKGSKDIIYFQTSQVSFESEEKLDWTIDGEYGGGYIQILRSVF